MKSKEFAMRTQSIETNEALAQNKWIAFRDATMRNAVNSTKHSSANKLRAERMKLALEVVYATQEVYINYGKKGISVKVEGNRVADRKNLSSLEEQWESTGVVKKVSGQGIIYRFSA
jgi:allophanate hydrolase subunit 1